MKNRKKNYGSFWPQLFLCLQMCNVENFVSHRLWYFVGLNFKTGLNSRTRSITNLTTKNFLAYKLVQILTGPRGFECYCLR